MDKPTFRNHFETLLGVSPFPWQEELWRRMIEPPDTWPRVVDIPTGLGKTSVIAVWLLALLNNTNRIPRRLVYVVNRRTVVDQTTIEVQKMRNALPQLNRPEFNTLAISTLRGQFADNREWFSDPSKPAVICGTVDMIGSRLLFGGYRIGFKSRPLHAGFLGQDALLIHDEAHLEPAFQKLIESIQQEQVQEKQTHDLPWPKLQVMALSATAREGNTDTQKDGYFTLSDEEQNPSDNSPALPSEPIHFVWRRLRAAKALRLHPMEDDKPAKRVKPVKPVTELAFEKEQTKCAVLIFLRNVKDAEAVACELNKRVKEINKKCKTPHTSQRVVTLTGTMRGYERDELVKSSPVFARFMPSSNRAENVIPVEDTAYLVCTAAGEVGVNLSADHMVCDLSTFDSMAQRLGRVNRFGERTDTRIEVVHPKQFKKKDKNGKTKITELDRRHKKTLALLRSLPRADGESYDASPLALTNLDANARVAAFAPEPTILPATDILFDAWAMTSIRESMPGRPPVAPYLHGVTEWEPPRTSVAWREEVEWITKELIGRHGQDFPQTLLDDYPVKPHELLSDVSERVYAHLTRIQERTNGTCPVWIIGDRSQVEVSNLEELLAGERKIVVRRIADCTIILPPSVGGLSKNGTLDGKSGYNSRRQDYYDIADRWLDENEQQRRVRRWDDKSPPKGMALLRVIDINPAGDEFDTPSGAGKLRESEAAEKEQPPSSAVRRLWYWYARPRDTEDATRTSTAPVPWDQHVDSVVKCVAGMANALGLPEDLKQAIILAAEFHDLGKKRELWQRSIGNPDPTTWYAKPGKPESGPPWRPRMLSKYRHEFGALLDAIDPSLDHYAKLYSLSEDMQDVVLHLIAAHHGYARPHFPAQTTIDPNHPQFMCDEAATEVLRRFARMQRRYGRWGLAYLESLLRAADWAVSAGVATLADSDDDHTEEDGL